jgi:hypothetical protein
MSGQTIVAIIAIAMALVLVGRGLGTKRIASRDGLLMGLAWIAIIAVLAFLLR